MGLNPDRVGHRYPTRRYEVSREKVREYALATGAGDPRYLAEDGDVVAPPTFAACFTLSTDGEWASDPDLGAHPALVHGSQEFTFHRPVHVGDALACTPSVAGVVVRGRTDLLTLQVDCVDAGTGEPVVTSRSTIVFFNPAEAEV